MAPRRALLIVNSQSRSGTASLDPALRRLAAGDVSITAEWRGSPDGIAGFIADNRHRVDAVIVGGGDGTVSAAAGALAGSPMPLGVLPLGTGNDFARTIGVPENLEQAADIIVAGTQRAVDVGEVNGIVFLNVASLGISVALATRITTETKRRFGPLGYALGTLGVLFQARPFHATIASAEGEVAVESLQIAIGNGRHYGGGLTIAPDARINDGELDLYSLETWHLWRLALLAPSFSSGTHGSAPDVRAAKGQWFEIRTSRPKRINVDGEIRTTTPARFSVRPGALHVFTASADNVPGLARQ